MTTADVSTDSVPVLIGTKGWVSGELYVLKDGEAVVLGRSRSCDISLRRIVAYLERSPSERDGDNEFNTVSRRHMRVTINGTSVKVEDLSTNGSYCNDEVVAEPRELDLSSGAIELRLGTRESFRLELADSQRLDALRSTAARSGAAGDTDGEAEADEEIDTVDPDSKDDPA